MTEPFSRKAKWDDNNNYSPFFSECVRLTTMDIYKSLSTWRKGVVNYYHLLLGELGGGGRRMWRRINNLVVWISTTVRSLDTWPLLCRGGYWQKLITSFVMASESRSCFPASRDIDFSVTTVHLLSDSGGGSMLYWIPDYAKRVLDRGGEHLGLLSVSGTTWQYAHFECSVIVDYPSLLPPPPLLLLTYHHCFLVLVTSGVP
jgi:hypothetical protein